MVKIDNGPVIFKLFRNSQVIHFSLNDILQIKNNQLGKIIPEVLRCQGIKQGSHHEFDVFTHTLEAVRHSFYLIEICKGRLNFNENYKKLKLDEIFTPDVRGDFLSSLNKTIDCFKKEELFYLSVLLHDIGKPDTKSIKISSSGQVDVSFAGHSKLGEKMAGKICERLNLTLNQTNFVKAVVRNHKGFAKITKSVSEKFNYENHTTIDSLQKEFSLHDIKYEIALITLADNLAKGKNFPVDLFHDLVNTVKENLFNK